MRVRASADGFDVLAIAGTRVVLLAMNCPEARTEDLLGFGVARRRAGSGARFRWLPSMKVFKSLVPDPRPALKGERPLYDTGTHPLQGFLWSDYAAEPDREYEYKVVPMFRPVGSMRKGKAIILRVRTESETTGRHRVWFNRGAIASQAFAREFGNRRPTQDELEDTDHPETVWLSRGLLEACLAYIREVPTGDALRVAAYELTYKPVLDELKGAIDRGVDVKIIYEDTSADGQANEKAIERSAVPKKVGNRKVLFPRHPEKGGIPHSKFMVHLVGGKAERVWTGSTNFTPSGFLGQTNVGHVVDDPEVAGRYLRYWKLLSTNPGQAASRAGAQGLSPDPPAVIDTGTTVVFSPRDRAKLLHYYGERIEDAATSACLTAAFGVNDTLGGHLAKESDTLRFLLLEKPPTTKLEATLEAEPDVITAYGIPLGQLYRFVDGKPVARRDIASFELDKWFLEEDHFRASNDGFVFFVHTKFLLVDPLSDDPLVMTGSANFSPKSLLANDENMLFIRGDTRVADIYLTEFDRIFRHFYARDQINEIVASGRDAQKPFLVEGDSWAKAHFRAGNFRCRRRETFFAAPTETWAERAAQR